MSGPSDQALKAAGASTDNPDRAFAYLRRDALEKAHDPSLSLDRSVCLRDVVEALRGSGALWRYDATDFIEREFGGKS